MCAVEGGGGKERTRRVRTPRRGGKKGWARSRASEKKQRMSNKCGREKHKTVSACLAGFGGRKVCHFCGGSRRSSLLQNNEVRLLLASHKERGKEGLCRLPLPCPQGAPQRIDTPTLCFHAWFCPWCLFAHPQRPAPTPFPHPKKERRKTQGSSSGWIGFGPSGDER